MGKLKELWDLVVRNLKDLDEVLLAEAKTVLEDLVARNLEYVSHAEKSIVTVRGAIECRLIPGDSLIWPWMTSSPSTVNTCGIRMRR